MNACSEKRKIDIKDRHHKGTINNVYYSKYTERKSECTVYSVSYRITIEAVTHLDTDAKSMRIVS